MSSGDGLRNRAQQRRMGSEDEWQEVGAEDSFVVVADRKSLEVADNDGGADVPDQNAGGTEEAQSAPVAPSTQSVPLSSPSSGSEPTVAEQWWHRKTGIELIDDLVFELSQPGQPTPPPEMEPFHARVLLKNANRFIDALGPIGDLIDDFEALMYWENPRLTGVLLLFYVLFVYYDFVIPGFILVVTAFYCKPLAIKRGYIKSVPPKAEDAPSVRAEPERPRGALASFISSLSTKVEKGVQGGQKAQYKLDLFGQRLEKVLLLIEWEYEENSMYILIRLVAAFGFFVVAPWPIITWIGKLGFGFKFFVSGAVYHWHPRLKERYDGTQNWWNRLPTVRKTSSLGASSTPDTQATGDGSPYFVGSGAHPPGANPPTRPPPPPAAAVAAAVNHPYSVENTSATATYRTTAPTATAPPPEVNLGLLPVAADEVADIEQRWQCVYVKNGQLTGAKTGKLMISDAFVIFHRGSGDEDDSFKFPIDAVRAVRGGGAAGGSGSGGLLSSMTASFGRNYTLVLDIEHAGVASSHSFGTMRKRDEAAAAISAAAGVPNLAAGSN